MALILIVDDSPELGPLLEGFLAKDGHKARFAYDGEEALKKMEGVDLVMLDVHLPVLDGPGVYRRLQADSKLSGIPVIFVSGSAGDADSPDGPKVRRLRKPFDPAQMLSLIRELLKP